MIRFINLFIVCSFYLIAGENDWLKAPQDVPKEYEPYIFATPTQKQWFNDAKFGVFLHWGPAAIIKERLSWSRFGKRVGHRDADRGVPADVYDQLYKRFNPTEFNADKWIQTFKDAGAKYIIFVTKHHDGFCMFDAKNTEYKITNTPFERDLCKEIAEACHKYGMRIFWYYSQPDWHHPDCLDEKNHGNYQKYMFDQLRQLCTDYGKIDGIWFDGLKTHWTHWETPKLLKMLRTLQPGILINSRAGRGLTVGDDKSVRYDFDNAELRFGKYEVNKSWEMCATITETWAWSGGKNIKPFKTCIRMLIAATAAGGNLALNTGPTPQGTINSKEVEVLKQMGSWLEKYGESIYNTKGGPYMPDLWGASTRKGNKIFLHITQTFATNTKAILTLKQPGLKIKNVSSLTGAKVKLINETKKQFQLELDHSSLNDVDNIIVLELVSDASKLPSIPAQKHKDLAHNQRASASSVHVAKNSPQNVFGEAGHVVREGARHKLSWIASRKDKSPWIAVDLGKSMTFDTIQVHEQVRTVRTRDFSLQYKKENEWITFFEGKDPGLDFTLKHNPIQAQHVRLKIIKSDWGHPNISFFHIYNTEGR